MMVQYVQTQSCIRSWISFAPGSTLPCILSNCTRTLGRNILTSSAGDRFWPIPMGICMKLFGHGEKMLRPTFPLAHLKNMLACIPCWYSISCEPVVVTLIPSSYPSLPSTFRILDGLAEIADAPFQSSGISRVTTTNFYSFPRMGTTFH